MYTAPTDINEKNEDEFDMRQLDPAGAVIVMNWQLGWIRDNPAAAPHQIRAATQAAIKAGKIPVKR